MITRRTASLALLAAFVAMRRIVPEAWPWLPALALLGGLPMPVAVGTSAEVVAWMRAQGVKSLATTPAATPAC